VGRRGGGHAMKLGSKKDHKVQLSSYCKGNILPSHVLGVITFGFFLYKLPKVCRKLAVNLPQLFARTSVFQ
jgi:hypothetical protein